MSYSGFAARTGRRVSVATAVALTCGLAASMLLSGCAGGGAQGKRPAGVTVTGESTPEGSGSGQSVSGGGSTKASGAGTAQSPTQAISDARFPALDAGWRDVGYRLDWVGYPFISNTGASQIREFAVSGNTVVALDGQGVVALLDGNTGQLRWSTQLATPLTRFVSLSVDPSDVTRIVASSESEAFLLSGGTGSLVARERFGKVVNTGGVMDGNLLVFGTASGEAIAHRLGTKLTAWAFLGVGTIAADPVKLSRTVGMVSEAGDVLFLDPQSGSLVGRARTFGAQASTPVSLGDAMVLASRDQSVWCFDENGGTRWRYRTAVRLESQPGVAPVSGGNLVVIDVRDEGLVALDGATGNVKWTNKTAGGSGEAVLVGVRAGNLLIQNVDKLFVVSPAGRIVREISVAGLERIVADKVVDGQLYAITSTNLVGKLTPR